MSSTVKTRRYIYDGQNVLQVLDEENEVLGVYTHSNVREDDVLAIEVTDRAVAKGFSSSAGSFFFLKDSIGSVEDIIDTSGEIYQSYIYSSFGKILKVIDKNGNNISEELKIEHTYAFSGREYDQESGTYYFRARSYDPHSGRFLQLDPNNGDILNPLSHINKYVYARNNPLSFKDPSGEFWQIALAIVLSVVGTYYSSEPGEEVYGINVNVNDNGEVGTTAYYGRGSGGRNTYVGATIGPNGQTVDYENMTREQALERDFLADIVIFGVARYGTKLWGLVTPQYFRSGVKKGKGGVYNYRWSFGNGKVNKHIHIDFYPVRTTNGLQYTGPTLILPPEGGER